MPGRKIPYQKPSLTVPQQIKKLESRGLIIEDSTKVEELLSHINYYRLEAYWFTYYDHNKTNDHFFVQGTTFDLIWKHYRFDRRLRACISHALERIEISLRTQLTFYLSQHYGPFPFDKNNFEFEDKSWKKNLKILQDSSMNSSEQFAKHFFNTYNGKILPVWALVEISSFGQVALFIKETKSMNIKNSISSVYDLKPRILNSWLEHLRYIRNICAHHSRLWNKRLTILPASPKDVNSHNLRSFWISSSTDGHYNERRLFNTILIIDYFLSKICPDNTWKEEIIYLIKKYEIDAQRMGFPKDWETLSYWKTSKSSCQS